MPTVATDVKRYMIGVAPFITLVNDTDHAFLYAAVVMTLARRLARPT